MAATVAEMDVGIRWDLRSLPAVSLSDRKHYRVAKSRGAAYYPLPAGCYWGWVWCYASGTGWGVLRVGWYCVSGQGTQKPYCAMLSVVLRERMVLCLVWYSETVWCYAQCGTERAYGTVLSVVLRERMVLPGWVSTGVHPVFAAPLQ
eukprot:3852964-Rhodomonas_salina.1